MRRRAQYNAPETRLFPGMPNLGGKVGRNVRLVCALGTSMRLGRLPPLLVFLGLAGCASQAPTPIQPQPPVTTSQPPSQPSFIQTGMASFYGKAHDGKLTASGDIFDPMDFTAAHRSLALGTRVRVTNLENRQTVIVKITDRGPFIRGRIIDVSLAAARALGMTDKGVARVRIEALPAISPAS